MNILPTPLAGLLIIEPKVFGDQRGFFMESYSAERYAQAGIKEIFVQDNVSLSRRGVLRGLHWQNPNAQGKLVSVLTGAVWDVAVDLRLGSKTFGQSFTVELNDENHRQFYVPPGFAHGFITLSETAHFCYKCTQYYNPKAEHTLMWNDPDLNICWPDISSIVVSEKDQKGVSFKNLAKETLISI